VAHSLGAAATGFDIDEDKYAMQVVDGWECALFAMAEQLDRKLSRARSNDDPELLTSAMESVKTMKKKCLVTGRYAID